MRRLVYISFLLLLLPGYSLNNITERLTYEDYFTFYDVSFHVNQKMVIQVYYDFDKSDILPESKKLLDSVYIFMLIHPELTFEIANHTDTRGNDKYNTKLSERRAKSVRDYLIGKGLPAERITARGAGESEPIYSDEYIKSKDLTKDQIEKCHQTNRRTVLTITGMEFEYPEGTEKFMVGNFAFFNKETLYLLFGNNSGFVANDIFSKAVITFRFNEAVLTADHPYRENKKVFMSYTDDSCYYKSIVILSKISDAEPRLIDSKENREVYQYDSCSDKWTRLDL